MDCAYLISIDVPVFTPLARKSVDAPCQTDVSPAAAELARLLLLAQSRPQVVSEAVENAAVAISRRQGEWGVDGSWSYDFSKLGYACSATCHDAHHESCTSSFVRCDVLKASFNRVLRSRGAVGSFRVLDLGAGSGGWLLQARRELEEQSGESPAIQLHGVTGDALPSVIQTVNPSRIAKSKSKTKMLISKSVEVAHFQQVGIEMFPLRVGGDSGFGDQHKLFSRTVEMSLAIGPGYDLIVSSWTFCHLIDPLATLEIWSNALAVHGELYVNDVDFSVLFDIESASRNVPSDESWESDQEKRMERTFEALNARGKDDRAFSIEFAYDIVNYRTAVKVTRLSAAPIRFGSVVQYSCMREGAGALLDSFGRPVYRVVAVLDH
mmetsp:Transcript_87149/g.136387  ORF Transcript_87149/g.136387 Transcript_87149/m.136387 type:complete len:380 (+) Transcript_87149:62-1201(+)